jgi:Tfp pilus assembly protein PilF
LRIGLNTPWLVKSDGRVVGPYLDKQISDLLREHVLRPVDEVARPCGRWSYIRDEPNFAKIVEEIRQRNLRHMDDTTTKGADFSDFTRTDSVSQTDTDDLTQEITQVSTQAVQDVLFHSVDDPQRVSPKSSGEMFTHEGDQLIKLRSSQATRWVWAATSVVLLLTMGFVVFRQFVAIPIQNKSVLDHSTTAGIDALEKGDYTTALELFDRAHALDTNDKSIYLYLGILKIQIENQAFQGRQLLEQINTSDSRDLKQVLTGIGLAYLKESDAKNAEAQFKKSLEIDPLFQYALVNLGATALYQEEWPKAINELQLSIKDGSHDGAEVLMLAEAAVHQFELSKDKPITDENVGYIDDYINKNLDYKLEAMVGRMYLEMLRGNKTKIYERIDQILDSDFNLTENHRHTLFIHRDRIGWNLISQWGLSATQDLDPNSHVVAFEALCLQKAGEISDAQRKIEDALIQTPKDPVVLAVDAYIMLELNSVDRAQVALEKSMDLNKDGKLIQPLRQAAAICHMQADRECEKKSYLKILEKEPDSLMALAGLARINLQEHNEVDAKKYLVQGLHVSDHYRPFYSINKAISQTEDKEKARGL